MFIAEKLIYIDLHKTGCTHIRKMLSDTIGGELVGKHNRSPHLDRTKYIFGSIRNPWDWYVSLWAYGCKHQGAIYGRTTRKFDIDCYKSGLQREMYTKFFPWVYVLRTMISDLFKPAPLWKKLYSDRNNSDNFKKWLHMIYDHKRKYDLGEGFGFSPISVHSGLYTYRYLKLYSDTINNLYTSSKNLGTYSNMVEFDSDHNVLNMTVRTEFLEEDLIHAITSAGYKLDEKQLETINNGKNNKTNASSHQKSSYYLDEDAASLIAEKERLIVDKYKYTYEH
ncbi:MAG: hypothetical protein GC149_17390 [Gammaproteobacteria bacterium]|nr:hypothetical protein [Gammaproteobacteria bacterium]